LIFSTEIWQHALPFTLAEAGVIARFLAAVLLAKNMLHPHFSSALLPHVLPFLQALHSPIIKSWGEPR
jgi:hypothetical protein